MAMSVLYFKVGKYLWRAYSWQCPFLYFKVWKHRLRTYSWQCPCYISEYECRYCDLTCDSFCFIFEISNAPIAGLFVTVSVLYFRVWMHLLRDYSWQFPFYCWQVWPIPDRDDDFVSKCHTNRNIKCSWNKSFTSSNRCWKNMASCFFKRFDILFRSY